MNFQKENTLSMYRAVYSFNLSALQPIKDSMYGYNRLMGDLEAKFTEIGTLNGVQGTSRIGYQLAKTLGKEVLVASIMPIVYLTKAFALDTANLVLQAKMNGFTPSKLLSMRDSKTGDFAEEIIAIATVNLHELMLYGITQTTIDKATEDLVNYRIELSKPRNSVSDRKGINLRINVLFKECNSILFHLDTLVKSIKDTELDFYNAYFNNRITVNYKGRILAIRGTVLDIDGNPIKNVIVSIPSLNIQTKTTDKGNYEFKSLPAGIVNLKFNKVTFQEVSENVGIVKGERIQLNITLNNSQSAAGAA